MSISSQLFTIINDKGLHARAAARFVEVVERFKSEVTVEKDGLEEMAVQIHQNIGSVRELISYYDGSGSIGRRYARADEIGVPWAITVDHESLENGTVTVRRRDDSAQIRIPVEQLSSHLTSEDLDSMF